MRNTLAMYTWVRNKNYFIFKSKAPEENLVVEERSVFVAEAERQVDERQGRLKMTNKFMCANAHNFAYHKNK